MKLGGLCAGRPWKMRNRQLHIQRTRVVDQEMALRVDHLTPRGRYLERSNASVGACLSDVLLAREDLQKPEPEEKDCEQRQREAAEKRHPPRQLRGQHRRTALISGRLDHLRSERGRGPKRSPDWCRGLRPPVV